MATEQRFWIFFSYKRGKEGKSREEIMSGRRPSTYVFTRILQISDTTRQLLGPVSVFSTAFFLDR